METSIAVNRAAWIVATLALVAPLLILPPLHDPANLPQTALIVVGAWGALLIRANGRECPRLQSLPVAPLLAFLGWAWLSLSWGKSPAEGVPTALHWTACAVVLYLVREHVGSTSLRLRILAALSVAGVLVAIVGLAQFYLHVGAVPQAYPPAATFMNKNVAAQFVVLALPFGLAWLQSETRTWLQRVGGLALGMQVLFLLVSFSRTAWLAFALEAVTAVALYRRRLVRRRATLLLIPVLGLLVIVFGLRTVHPRLGVDAGTHLLAPVTGSAAGQGAASQSRLSVTTRLSAWRNIVALIAEQPVLGVGLGNLKVVYPKYARRAAVDPMFGERTQLDFAHDDLLQFVAELGLIGMALLIWVATEFARRLKRSWTDPDERGTTAPVAIFLVGLGIEALFGFPFYRALPPFLAAVALALVSRMPAGSAVQGPVHPAARWTLALALLLQSGLAVAAMVGDAHLQRALAAERAGDWPRAARTVEQACGWMPWAKEPRFVAASAALHLGSHQEAARLLEDVIRRYPYDIPAIGNLAAARMATGDWLAAAQLFGRLAQLLPEDGSLHAQRGSAFDRAGRLGDAREEYRLALQGAHPRALDAFRLAIVDLRLGDRDGAETGLREALRLDPRFAPAHKALGVLLLEAGRAPAEGREHLRAALALDPAIKDGAEMRALLDRETRPGR